MKPKILLLLLWVCLCFYLNNVSAQSANITLSNLTAPTSVNQSLLPDSNNTINLGSVSKSWRVLYVENNIYLKDSMFLHNKGVQNTFVGNRAGFAITSGSNNAGFGYHALYSNTRGTYNTASGSFALYKNTTGNNNTASGAYALYQNVAGSLNTATGIDALYYNDAGGYNTATGAYALLYNTGGSGNVGTGINALLYNTTGNNNTADGTNALYYNLSGYSNVAIGVASLYNNIVANNNVAVGDSTLYNNNSDYDSYHGYKNTAVGSKSLYSNTTGQENTAVGNTALSANVDANWNTAIGARAMESNTSGYENTAIGFSALAWNVTGNKNTSLGGHDIYTIYPALDNNTSVGYNAQISASDAVRIGNGSVSSIGGAVGWTNFSDERIKNNIKENVPGLAFIKLLRPVTYNFSLAKENEVAGVKNDTAKWKTKYDIEKINFTGFLAQEVFAAAKKLNYDFSGVDKAGKIWGLRYGDFVVPLVKAVQELSAKNDSLQKQNNDFERRIARLESMMNVLNQSTINNAQSAIVPAAMLEQNIPNPFINNTIINYTLPQKFTNAQIVITDKNGRTLKAISVSGNGKSTLNVDAATLAAGAYQYSLMIDGKLVTSKQMIVTK